MSATPIILLPNELPANSLDAGVWETNTSATDNPTILIAISDNDNVTYAHKDAGSFWRSIGFQETVLPLDARIRSVTPYYRAKSNSSAQYWRSQMRMGTQAAPSTLHEQSGSNHVRQIPTSSISDYAAIVMTQSDGAEPISNDMLNNIQMSLNNYFSDGAPQNVRMYKIWLSVLADEKPVTSAVSPIAAGNTVFTDTSTPTFTWSYSDDWELQAGFQVQVLLNSDNSVIVDSGSVTSSETSWTPTGGLAQGTTYKVRVRTRQNWSGAAAGDFWGDWAYSVGTFSLTVVDGPETTVSNEGAFNDSGAVYVEAQHNMNLLGYDDAAFENGFLGWGQGAGNLTGGTLASNTNATYIFEGLASLKITQSATTSTITNRNLTAVIVGRTYGFSYRSKVDAASTVGSMTAEGGVNWYDSFGGYISTTFTNAPGTSKTNWVTTVGFAVAPANAAFANQYIYINNGASGRIVYTDCAEFLMMAVGDTSYSIPSRGGMLLPTKNLITLKDSSFGLGTTAWEASSANTTLALSATQSRQGLTSLKINRTAGSSGTVLAYLNTGKIAAPDFTNPGYTVLFASLYPTSATNFFFGVAWCDSTGTEVAWSETTVAAPTLNTWTDKHQAVANPSNSSISYGLPYVYFTGVAASGINYTDALMIAQEPTSALFGYQPGYTVTDGPYTVIQGLDVPGFPDLTQAAYDALAISNPSLYATYQTMITDRYAEAAAGAVSWQTLRTVAIDPDFTSSEIFDRSAQSGVARMYRAYTYKYDAGVLITSQPEAETYDGITCPTTINFTSIWISTVSQKEDLVNGGLVEDGFDQYEFTTGQSGSSESFKKDYGTFQPEGREFPVITFGTTSSKSIAVTIALTTAAELAAFQQLTSRASLVIFRNGFRSQRIKGVLTGISYSYPKGFDTVSFTIQAAGDQYE